MKNAIDKEIIKGMTFESDEPANLWEKHEKSSYMLTASDRAGMPMADDKRIEELRRRLAELFAERLNCNYSRLECDCDIKPNTFQKVLRFWNGRNITYTLLAKFCVGTRLTVGEAEELFQLMGHQLSDKNRSDYILKRELANKSDILEYDRDLKEQGLKGILSDPGENDNDET